MSPVRYVVGFLFCQGEVVLIRKAHPQWQKGKLNGVGGHVEKDETFLDAIRREFYEETGVKGLIWEQFAIYFGEEDAAKVGATGGFGAQFEIGMFRAEVKRKPSLAVNAEEPVAWFDVRHLDEEKTIPNVHWLIPMALFARREDWPFAIHDTRRLFNASTS